MCAIDLGNFLTRAILASVNHTLRPKGGGFCTLNTSLECHKVINYPFSILIRAAYRQSTIDAARFGVKK